MPRSDARKAMTELARFGSILGLLGALLASACGGDSEPPATPANQRYGFDGDLVEIRWDPSPGAETYAVFHATRADADCQAAFGQVEASSDQATVSPSGSSSGCAALGQGLLTLGLSHRLDNAIGAEHYIWVVACNDAGCSPIDRENPAQPPPASPTGIQAELDGSAVRISWDPVDGASEYQVYFCDEASWCQRIASSVRETSFVHELPLRQPWGVEVIDRSEDSLSLRWAESHGGSVNLRYQVAACNGDFCSPAAVATLSYVDIGVYHLQRRTADSQFTLLRNDLSLAQYVDQNLDPDTTYYYTVQYCNDAGCSPPSDETGGVTEAEGPVDPPATPTGFVGDKIDVSGRGDDARVSWLTVEGATWYEVHQDSDGYSLDARISAPQTSHYDNQPNRGPLGTYWTTSYKVRACNKAGCSSFTDVVTLD